MAVRPPPAFSRPPRRPSPASEPDSVAHLAESKQRQQQDKQEVPQPQLTAAPPANQQRQRPAPNLLLLSWIQSAPSTHTVSLKHPDTTALPCSGFQPGLRASALAGPRTALDRAELGPVGLGGQSGSSGLRPGFRALFWAPVAWSPAYAACPCTLDLPAGGSIPPTTSAPPSPIPIPSPAQLGSWSSHVTSMIIHLSIWSPFHSLPCPPHHPPTHGCPVVCSPARPLLSSLQHGAGSLSLDLQLTHPLSRSGSLTASPTRPVA